MTRIEMIILERDKRDDFNTYHAMVNVGGSFVRALAEAWIRADEGNRARLKAAFPELWDKYKGLS